MGSKPGIEDAREPRVPKLASHIKRLYPTLEQKVTAADAVRSLVGHPGWKVLQEMSEAESEDINRTLDHGQVLGRAEYAKWHGRRGGLRFMDEAIRALIVTAEARLAEQRAKHEGDAAEPATLQEVA